jgi:hypothetical protein
MRCRSRHQVTDPAPPGPEGDSREHPVSVWHGELANEYFSYPGWSTSFLPRCTASPDVQPGDAVHPQARSGQLYLAGMIWTGPALRLLTPGVRRRPLRPVNAGITPLLRASLPRSSASSSTTGHGPPGPARTGPSSITSKAGTTPGGSIPPSAISAPPNTSQPTTTPPDRMSADAGFGYLSQAFQDVNMKLTAVAQHLVETGELLGASYPEQ